MGTRADFYVRSYVGNKAELLERIQLLYKALELSRGKLIQLGLSPTSLTHLDDVLATKYDFEFSYADSTQREDGN